MGENLEERIGLDYGEVCLCRCMQLSLLLRSGLNLRVRLHVHRLCYAAIPHRLSQYNRY